MNPTDQTPGLALTGLRGERLWTAGVERRQAGEGLEKTCRVQIFLKGELTLPLHLQA